MTSQPFGPWVVISDYPSWPSPYFAELQRHAPKALGLEFATDLESLARRTGWPGVINLHRLKRLYRRPDGTSTRGTVQAMLDRLTDLRTAGWRVVWTVHNLLPIDNGPPAEADHLATTGVLKLADAVMTHTRADAVHLAELTTAPITVAGWAGLTAGRAEDCPRDVENLVRQIVTAPFSVLVVGNLTAYKDVPAVVRAFAADTSFSHLFVVGPSREKDIAEALAEAATLAAERIHLYLNRVPPRAVHALYRAADAALCPYRSDGPWEFFTRLLYPGSVGTAVAFGTPVIAPDLPAIREMTAGHPRWLYPPATGPGAGLIAAENGPRSATPRAETDGTRRWKAVGATYERLSRTLRAEPPRPVTVASRPPPVAAPETAAARFTSTALCPCLPEDSSQEITDRRRQVPATTTPAESIAAVLADRYGLDVQEMVPLPIGQGTINYRATSADGDVFVKNYLPGTDLAAEERAIELSELARHHAIPAPPVLSNRDAQVIDTSTPLAVSVWQWMPGSVITTLDTSQYARAGHVLGRMHAVFAELPESTRPAPQAEAWRNVDISALATTTDRLLALIAERAAAGIADTFDAEAERTLIERRAMLPCIPGLLADLPADLTAQVVHGDYSPVNLLFNGDELTAVLDFRPPDPFLVAYDLGRMAFYPNTVTGDPHWQQAARTLIGAYLAANPAIADTDIRACGRVALLQLLRSLYGVKQHYLKPGLFQDDLDEFWLLRHRTAKILLDHMPETDKLLADLATA